MNNLDNRLVSCKYFVSARHDWHSGTRRARAKKKPHIEDMRRKGEDVRGSRSAYGNLLGFWRLHLFFRHDDLQDAVVVTRRDVFAVDIPAYGEASRQAAP